MPYIFNKYYPLRSFVFLIGEALLIFFSLLLVSWLFKGTAILRIDLAICVQQALLVTLVFQSCLYFLDLYDFRSNFSMTETAVKITQAFGAGCIILGAFYYFMPAVTISSRIFWSGYFIIYILILLWRAAYNYVFKHRLFVQSIIIFGTGKLARDITREIEDRYDSPYRILGFAGAGRPDFNPRGIDVYQDMSVVQNLFPPERLDRIVVALDDRRGGTPIELLLNYKLQGVAVEEGARFFERLTGKIMVEKVDPSAIIYSDGFAIGKIQSYLKRGSDIILAVLLLLLASPIMLLAALIIKLESPGPFFYSQERVGKGRQTFNVLKFRSMVQDAEKNGAIWAAADDARVTRFGKFIRKTRIDELPQLFNVLKGEMSLVGPRPERPVFVEQLKKVIPFYDIRHDIRPGVTGWAQVCYPYGASEEDALRKLEYDLYYMKHISLALDVLVIFKTIKTVLFAKGGR
ncbi:TIGR03013 family XrtA/PEP-CTERM system glycosyltransferase [Desulfofustis glycolicus]|uniref:Sugar transferase, PEP-CTERM system associated/exopolysaccharide biosynthesis polyprenyl glycosylphosphotransferase n=1 Tax=Desulfofustis glycolicus DSM 9705 TaxID=1121409 RepID=A0A1M5W9P9_9BACT|nr:TIGR03013 family XrtA/PEP-CTERM system glycosyltransferase [Desulfofustis glycolicus]MCB2217359.1 TIGR03013 family PEP-CTERM/XrtA system glycosyltransferase [Desulfobulbaceae bacterium]SHH84242.1 sugar transferase, PEP-CTERM system associated/exopolysaccharide biosynthesis polyprenyl glycosylphosphotransferase [Desulfofustis glycolicus DSM 9705]